MNRGIYLSNNPLHIGDPRTTNLYHDLKNLSFRLARNAAPPGLVKFEGCGVNENQRSSLRN